MPKFRLAEHILNADLVYNPGDNGEFPYQLHDGKGQLIGPCHSEAEARTILAGLRVLRMLRDEGVV